MRFRILIIMTTLAAILVVGCTPAGLETNPSEPVTPVATPQEEPGEGEAENVDASELSGGEVPQSLFDTILADLLERSGSDRSSVEIVKSESVQWNDGSLGCPQPDMMYTQAIVPGYQVIFSIGGETYDYHLSERGQFVLCADSQAPPALESTE